MFEYATLAARRSRTMSKKRGTEGARDQSKGNDRCRKADEAAEVERSTVRDHDVSALDPSDEGYEDLRRRSLIRRFWQGARGFWSNGRRRSAWLLSGALFIIIVLLLGAAYGMNVWTRAIFD